jgi:hypothetical protein
MEAKQKKKLIMVVVITIIVILLASSLVFFFLLNKGDEEEGEGNNVNPSNDENTELAATITVTSTNKRTNDGAIDIDISIPVLSGLEDKKFEYDINTEMAKDILAYESEVYVMASGDVGINKYTFKTRYEKYVNDDYLSLVIPQEYTTGGIRSNRWKDTYNIDARKGKRIYLADLFDPTEDFQKAIISEINKQATEDNVELVGGVGLSNIPEKQKFYIKDKKLIIYFDPAGIAPYVFGELHFEMPFRYENGNFYID